MKPTTQPHDDSEKDRQQWLRETVDTHAPPLLRYARSLTDNIERARDGVQETFLRLVRAKREDVEHKIPPWLYRVCRSRIIDMARKEGAMTTLDDTRGQPTPEATPALAAERSESAARARAFLKTLPGKEREVVRLKFQNGLSYREIAEITDLSVNHVGVLLHTAMNRLREHMAVE